MLNDFYKQFKSGTDIRGVASEGVEGQSVNLTDDVVADMADGFVLWLSKKVSKKPSELKISVGRDSRISGPHIMKITTERFKRCGAEVLCCQLASTPSMFMTTVDLGCDGALQITASHHPFNRNGLKFFTREGGLEGSDIEEILLYAQNGEHPEESNGGNITDVDYMSDYAKGLCEKIKRKLMQKITSIRSRALRLLLTQATVQADFMPTRCFLFSEQTQQAAVILNLTECSRIMCRIPRLKRQWIQSVRLSENRAQTSA